MTNKFLQNAKSIYEHLTDEESKDIFEKRILLSLTGDWKHARYLAKNYLRGYHSDKIFTGIIDNLHELSLNSIDEYIIYGAGEYGRQTYLELKQENLKVIAFCDTNKAKQGTIYQGLPVISLAQLADLPQCKILMAVWNQSSVIRKKLLQLGIEADRVIDCFLCENYLDSNQYFDEDIIHFGLNEVFLDCGCFDFGTSEIFAKKCPDYQKVICFEPNEFNRQNIARRIAEQKIERVELYPYGVWNKETTLCFHGEGSSAKIDTTGEEQIEAVSIDGLVIETATFIKMDIEGSELKALEGARNTILKYKPKLAISIYHKPEDIITLPSYILELVPEYKLYLRHYSNYFATETVLYAVL